MLQSVELNCAAENLSAIIDIQAASEGVSQAKTTIRALAKSALESPTVREAATRKHWKELFVAAPVGGTVVEGYVDLLYRGPEGLAVVDYKTDDTSDDDAYKDKVDRYKIQVAAYSLAVEQSTGERVARCVLVFARNGQPAIERDISGDELASAQREVRRRLASAAA